MGYDPLKNVRDDILKAALDLSKTITSTSTSTTSGWFTGAAAAALESPEIQRAVVQLVDRNNPLRENLPRVGGEGAAYYFTTRAAATTLAQFVGETTDPDRDVGARKLVQFAYKTIAARGRIGRLSAKISSGLFNVLNDELTQRIADFRDYEDYAFIRGNMSTDSNAYDGLNRLLGIQGVDATNTAAGTTFATQVIDAVYATGAAPSVGATVTAALLDYMLDKVSPNNPSVILCTKAGRRAIVKLIHAQGQYVNTVTVAGGHIVPTWQGVPILVSSNVSDACQNLAVTAASASTYTGFTGGTYTSFYCVAYDDVFVSELTPVTTMPLAQISSQYQDFDIFTDETLVYKWKGGASALTFINPRLGSIASGAGLLG